MKDIVFVPGVWDMLHFGHIKFLERASRFGDVIIAGIESDELVVEEKGRLPTISLKDRILAVEGLKYVDIAVPFYDFDYISYLQQYNVDVLILSDVNKGSDKNRFKDATKYMLERNKRVIYLPYNKDISSTKIKEKIQQDVLEFLNPWKPIWERVGEDDNIDDIKVVSNVLTEEKVKTLADYMTKKLRIMSSDTVLDFGCGSAVILKNTDCKKFGIDISKGMIKRAVKNCPDGIFLADDHIPYMGRFDHVICYGVIYYLPSLEYVSNIVEEMKGISNSIIIMEIPDITKKELREKHRDTTGKAKYPEQLYFEKKWFEDRGFEVFDNELSLTNHSDYGFTALYKK